MEKLLKYLLFLLSSLIFISCVPVKKITLIQEKGDNNKTYSEYEMSNVSEQKIQAHDELYIEVSAISTSTETNFNFFNAGNENFMRMSGSGGDYSLISYSVSDSGYVNLPIVGKINVLGLNLDEASNKIGKELQSYMNLSTVKVKFVNRQISVLGEVLRPGTFPINKNNLNIYQAIGLAGDFNEYGNREEVLLLRNTGEKQIRVLLDLTKVDIINSEYFYVRDDDVIYVEPLKRRVFGLRTFPFDLIFEVITTPLLVWSIITNINNINNNNN